MVCFRDGMSCRLKTQSAMSWLPKLKVDQSWERGRSRARATQPELIKTTEVEIFTIGETGKGRE